MKLFSLIALIVIGIVLVILAVHSIFVAYKCKNKLIASKTAKTKTKIDLLLFIFCAICAVIPFIISFSYTSIIIVGFTVLLCTLIHFGYKLIDESITYDDFFGIVGNILLITFSVLGLLAILLWMHLHM